MIVDELALLVRVGHGMPKSIWRLLISPHGVNWSFNPTHISRVSPGQERDQVQGRSSMICIHIHFLSICTYPYSFVSYLLYTFPYMFWLGRVSFNRVNLQNKSFCALNYISFYLRYNYTTRFQHIIQLHYAIMITIYRCY